MKPNDPNDLFRIKTEHTPPAQGCLLLSEPFLIDASFGRSAVLLIDHNAEGSMGIVLNKPLPVLANDVVNEFKYLEDIPIYSGGPMADEYLFFIHTLPQIPDALPLGRGLYFNGDFNEIKRYILQGNPIEGRIRFFLGYSGWAPGQLQQEIEEDTWIVTAPTPNLIMHSDNDLWQKSLSAMGQKYRIWSRYPQIPDMN